MRTKEVSHGSPPASRSALARERALLLRRLAEIDAAIGPEPGTRLSDARHELVVVLDGDGVILEASRAARDLAAGAEILGRRPWEIPGREGLGPACRAAFERLAGDPALEIDAIVETVDGVGKAVALDLTLRATTDEEGALDRIIAEATDITARRRAEQAAQVSETRLHDALDEIDDVITLYSVAEQRIVHLGGSIWALLGQAPGREEISQAQMMAAIHPDDRAQAMAAHQHLVTHGASDVELRIVRPSGEIRWVRSRSRAIRDERGRVVRTAGVMSDVTDRRVAEEALREREHRFRCMLDSARDIIAIAGPDHRYAFVSSAVERVLGYTVEEYCGRALRELLHPDDVARVEAIRARVRSTPGASATMEARVRHKDGHYVWMESSGVNLIDDPAIGGVLSTQHDVGERVAAREAMERWSAELEARVEQRTAALERASRAKDEFLAAVSHELRTPLNGMLGLSEALEEEVYGPLAPRQRKAIGQVRARGADLLALIESILDQSSLALGTMTLARASVPVVALCRSALRAVEREAERKQQTLAFSSEDPGLSVDGDERRLGQVLVNLLGNAVKFTPDRGSIGLAVRANPGRGVVVLAITDTGCGIGAEDLERIFLPFVQLDARLAREHAGAGLGLSVARRIVDLHGGTLGVESEIGQGSRFTVTLRRWGAWEEESG